MGPATLGNVSLPIWQTEFNYGLDKTWFLPQLEFGALHGMFHAARIIAAVNLSPQVQSLQFQTLVHPLNYTVGQAACHRAMPVTRMSNLTDRPDLAMVSGTAQVVAHLAALAMGNGGRRMVPVTVEGGDSTTGPWVLGATQPCLQAAAFVDPNGTLVGAAVAILNVCNANVTSVCVHLPPRLFAGRDGGEEDVSVSVSVRTTTYSAADRGGWAPLPSDPQQHPWATGPLHPVERAWQFTAGEPVTLTMDAVSLTLLQVAAAD